MDNKYERIQIINSDTGEVLGNTLKTKSEEVVLSTKRILTDKQKAFLNNLNDFKSYASGQGGFVQMLFLQKHKLDLGNCDKATLSRLVYLSTYIDYNNRQENLLVKKGIYNTLEPMTRKDIQYVLKLGDTAFRSFMADVKLNNLIYEIDNKFYVTDLLFTKGEIAKDKSYNGYAKLFIKCVRSLYEGTTPRQHKVLSNVFMLIPFIHINTNIITFDPDTTLDDHVNPMSLEDIGELLDIEDNKGNLKKLVKDLEKFTVKIETIEYKMFTYVMLSDRDYFVINPRVVYRGNDYEKMCWVADTYFFRNNKK